MINKTILTSREMTSLLTRGTRAEVTMELDWTRTVRPELRRIQR